MIGLFRILARVPLALMQALGWLLGWVVFIASSTYRTRFVANAAQAGLRWGQWSGAVGAAGQLVTELPRLWFGPVPPVLWEGDHVIDEALRQGRGILFLTPHLGCFEVTAQAYAQRFGARNPMTVLFRPARKAGLSALIASARSRPGLKVASTTLGGVKQMIKALRQGEAVGLLPDQVPPLHMGLWVPFFGRQAYTMTLSVRLAQLTNATVLIAWGERLAWGKGYIVHVEPLVQALPQDLKAATQCVNQAMQALVLRCPQQYLWGYARYKEPRLDV